MSVIAEFTVKSDDLTLHHALTAAPQMVVEIEQVVATMEDRVMPYFWVSGGDHAEFEAAFEGDDSVTNIAPIDEADGARLYRAEWTQNVESIVYAYIELGATILQAVGRAKNWELRMRFDDRDSLSQFQTYCEDNGIGYELNRIQEQEQPMASAQYDLTTKQRETLVTALEAGYYEIPQRITMSETGGPTGDFPAGAVETVSRRTQESHHEHPDVHPSGRRVDRRRSSVNDSQSGLYNLLSLPQGGCLSLHGRPAPDARYRRDRRTDESSRAMS